MTELIYGVQYLQSFKCMAWNAILLPLMLPTVVSYRTCFGISSVCLLFGFCCE